jgi:uncharacterized delta-60 repeat protein
MKRIVMFFVFLFSISSFLFSQDGALDITFNSTGKVTTSIGSGYDFGKSVAIQSDGKIIVAGVYSHGTDDDFAVVRYTSAGALDNTFGTGGIVTTSIGSHNDAAYSVAIQSDGKIVVAGLSSDGSKNHIAVVRYTSVGALDAGFGTGGIVTTVIGSSDNPGFGVAIQSDGKILVSGYAHIGLNDDFAVVRYSSVGALDGGFGTGGIVTTNFGSGVAAGNSVAIQSDGKIVVAGYFSSGGSAVDFAVARYTSTGALDNTFDTDGKVTTAIGSASDVGNSVAIQSDGKIVVAGYAHIGSTDDFAVVRYTSNGALDNSFDTDGIVTTAIGTGTTDWGYSVALQLDGKIVVAGFTAGNNIAVVRYTSTGALDNTFGTTGKVTTAVGSHGSDGVSVALQSDGKVVVAGDSYTSGSTADFAVVRYTGSSGPLPVELTSFTASVITSSVELKWVTATEVNNYGFEIERTVIGNQQSVISWKNVGFVEGAGTTNAPKEYSYSDKNISVGKYSYRLKQIDRDGKFEYSQTVEVTAAVAPKVFALEQNYPNPFNPSTVISYQLPLSGQVSLKVYDAVGREVATLVNEVKEAGSYTAHFDGTKLSSGIYFARLVSAGKTQMRKLLLMK